MSGSEINNLLLGLNAIDSLTPERRKALIDSMAPLGAFIAGAELHLRRRGVQPTPELLAELSKVVAEAVEGWSVQRLGTR